jgi:subtilase family serine protease
MSKRRALVCLLLAVVTVSGIGQAAIADRIAGDLANGPKVALRGNVHGLARPEFDLGRADGSRPLQGVSLAFRPSPAQQKDLDRFLAELANPKSPNFHKYLTPAQFGERFGLSLNDIAKITNWLQSQGFTNIKVANGRNQISFDGNVGQIESAFSLEMHNYAVDGVVHLANAGEPGIPAALAGMVIGLGSLHDFAPKPRAKIQSHLTSYVSGNHFLTPADFATIYDINPLYSAGADGTGQSIAVVGQSTVSTTDLDNFRSAAGLAPSTVTMTLSGGTAAKCSGDEGESDLDIEWSGGVAKGAQIIFVFAGLGSGDTCSKRGNNVWNALQYAVDHNVAPFIGSSYGFCESGLGNAFSLQVQGWAKQGITQGQTIVAASGDAGAADCEAATSISAKTGLAVDVPAAIPEVVGAGGNEFTGDKGTCSTTPCPGNVAPADDPYWGPSNTGSDAVSTALEYIPEMAWNDTTASISSNPPGGLSASGGGASIYFSKPTWQAGQGVPPDGKRDVPDISLNASNFHDPYLVCSEDGDSTPCASGFRDSAGGNFFAVGGTSAVAPTFAAILALVNQYVGNTPPTGLAPVNPTLYQFPGNTPAPFHDVKSGNNKVPCTSGTTNCPAGTTQIGFTASTGYDQVTGLGSVDAFALAEVWKRTPTTVALSPSTTTSNLGENVTFTATVSPSGASGTVNIFNNGSTTPIGSGTLSGGTAAISTVALPLGSNKVTATYTGDSSFRLSSSPAAVVTTSASFTLTPSPAVGTLSVAQGQTSAAVNLIVSSTQGFVLTNGSGSTTALPVTYTCSGLPSEATCNFSGGTGSGQTITTSATAVSFTVSTTAPTARLQRPMDRSRGVFYAVLLPGLFGIVFLFGSRRRSPGSLPMLAMLVMLSLSTMWMASCGGTSSNKNPGTPTGSFPFTVNATTGGGAALTSSVKFTLSVTP